MHDFEHQSSRQNLSQGIAEYHEKNPRLARASSLSVEAQAFFRCHDAAHVVFGCGNSLDDEAVVKVSSLFGTTAGMRVLKGYRLHDSLEIYRQLRARDVLGSIARAVVIVPRTLLRCSRQRRRWPWQDFEPYLSVPLCELRAEFGIKVPHSGGRARPDRG
jgi:hypothetical protein